MTHSGSVFSTQLSGLLTQILDHEVLFIRVQAGHTLVTGNSRLARVLTTLYNQWCLDRGESQWLSPKIIAWNLWLDKLWETASLQGIAGSGRAVPGSRQLISLWENTLKNEPLAHQLLRPESLAKQLLETRRLMRNWQLDFKDPAWFDDENENYSAFYYWNKAFEKRCVKDDWISPEDRTALLGTALRDSQLVMTGAIDLLGFDEFNTSQIELLSALLENGNPICQLTITARQNKALLWKSIDARNELEQMARWVRYWFEKEPDASIAIVVPDLQSRRQEVERQLEEILTPGAGHDVSHAKPWNISMGRPLFCVPMIETAFDLLKLLDHRIDIQDIGRVLRSPWLQGAANERNSRALLEKQLREKYPRQLKLADVRYRAGEIKRHDHHGNELPDHQHEPRNWNSPVFAAVVNSLIRFEQNNRGRRPASGWAESFDQLLLSLGWPLADEAGTPVQAEEHGQNWQALQAWREALRELASLDATIGQLGCKAAIGQLKQICREKIFQPHTPAAPIQVLGLYEVSGLRFDHLWVLGLHNDNWPPAARPNPFIPKKLQKAAQLPNSSPQRELEVARTITSRLLETAPDCVFSYPGKIDGEDVLASSLLSVVTSDVNDLPAWQGDRWRSAVARGVAPQIEALVMPGKLSFGTARGGSSILKHQALCPFRAFASNRLGADGLETPVDGISAMLHGSLVHSVLEEFWKETKTQSALLALNDEDLKTRVHKHVDAVVKDEKGLKQRPSFLDVQAQRLYRHVMDYLALEKERDDFEVVGFEREILPEIEGQAIRLFIDRVDRLPSGEEIIIDYKTGTVEPKKWFDDRPEDPQLPLYAISAENTPAAVVFGIIRDDGCLYKGVVSREGLLPGLPPRARKGNQDLIDAGLEMPKTIKNWHRILHRLMADFLAGEAAVDPKNGLKTCEKSYCKLQSLCRIGELEQRRKTGQKNKQQDVST